MKLTKRLTLLLGATAIVATACPASTPQNVYLEADANAIVKAMIGSIEYRGTGVEECSGHHAATGGTQEFSVVCVSGGLSTADSHRGSDALHEAGHAWFHRVREWYVQRSQTMPKFGILIDEEYACDCFAQVRGAPSKHSHKLVGQPCSQQQLEMIHSWMVYFPVDNSTRWVHNT